jgi:quercetin dioxygenase-like cupin family protein
VSPVNRFDNITNAPSWSSLADAFFVRYTLLSKKEGDVMIRILAAAVLSFSGLFPSTVQSPVPVANEPRHHLKFENEYVRVFDVVVPPGDATLFHIHASDYAFVSIGDATLKAEVMGNQPGDMITKDGEARFTKGPITHRVTNVARTPFRNITIEILKSPGPVGASTPDTSPGHSVVLDNDRVRIERLILEPGQSTNIHTHNLSALSVFVTKSKVRVESKGAKPETIEYKPGDFRWRAAPVTHSIKNIGSTRFEAVGVDWK